MARNVVLRFGAYKTYLRPSRSDENSTTSQSIVSVQRYHVLKLVRPYARRNGSRSSMSLFRQVGNFSITILSQAEGSSPLSLAVANKD